jgi:hypothetical protein
MQKHKIARIVLTNQNNTPAGKAKKVKPDCNPKDATDKTVANALNLIIGNESGKRRFEYVLTPAGVLKFPFPTHNFLSIGLCDEPHQAENSLSIGLLQQEAEEVLLDFINNLDSDLSKITDFFVVGIDSYCNKTECRAHFTRIDGSDYFDCIAWMLYFCATKGVRNKIIHKNHFTSRVVSTRL